MPRSSRSSGGRASAPVGSRSASTMAAPRQQQAYHPQPATQRTPATATTTTTAPAQGPGLFANMASTAAGVAVGSSIGHGLSNMLFGGSTAAPPVDQAQGAGAYPAYDQTAQQQQQQQQQQQAGAYQQLQTGNTCEAQAKDFTRCLESTNNDFQSCSWYLEALKACQQAARTY